MKFEYFNIKLVLDYIDLVCNQKPPPKLIVVSNVLDIRSIRRKTPNGFASSKMS